MLLQFIIYITWKRETLTVTLIFEFLYKLQNHE